MKNKKRRMYPITNTPPCMSQTAEDIIDPKGTTGGPLIAHKKKTLSISRVDLLPANEDAWPT